MNYARKSIQTTGHTIVVTAARKGSGRQPTFTVEDRRTGEVESYGSTDELWKEFGFVERQALAALKQAEAALERARFNAMHAKSVLDATMQYL